MKDLLFIAYYFPPMGGGGVQRSLKFAKYLPEFGFRPIVLTSEHAVKTRWILSDEMLMKQLDPNLPVYRTPPIVSLSLPPDKWKRAKEMLCLTGRFESEWRAKAIEQGRKICHERRPSAIYVSMSPFVGCSIAQQLSAEFSIPWIADLRDPWALDEMMIYPSAIHRRIWQFRMVRGLRNASRIIMNTPVAEKRLKRLLPSCASRTTSITNGYDETDFSLPSGGQNLKFTIAHTGSLHSDLADKVHRREWLNRLLGRTPRGLDFSTRSHIYLIQALESLINRRPELRNSIRVHLIGPSTERDRKIVAESTIANIVQMTEFLPHRETIAAQKSADLLFLPMQNLPEPMAATIVPGKTYEYLACGVPILGALPTGDARDFLQKSGLGTVVRPNDSAGLAAAIESQIEQWSKGQTKAQPNQKFIARFERRALTRQLALEIEASISQQN